MKEDVRVKYFYQENKGVAAARNLGIKNATGEYVLFCDSDDEWKKNLLEVLVKEMQESACDMVRFGFESKESKLIVSDDLPEKVYSQKELFLEYFSDNKIYKNMSSCCFGIFKLGIIKKNNLSFDERLKHGEDGKFVVQYITYCADIKYINRKLYVYYPFFEERITATSRQLKELYDEYELCGLLFEEFYKKWNDLLNEEEKRNVYSAFYDRVIGRLVRFAAYSSKVTRKKDIAHLKIFLLKPYVVEAGKYYKRKRDTDSRIVPYLMKRKKIHLLWAVLRSKKDNYYRLYGKKRYAASFWKKNPLVEI